MINNFMETSVRAIRLNFSKNVKSEFNKMSDLILQHIKKITPPSQFIATFVIHGYEDRTQAFKAYWEDGGMRAEEIKDLTWDDLEYNIPGLENFIKKYSLEKSWTIATGHAVPPHRHYFTKNSMWSISMFKGQSSGTIQFYHNQDKVGADELGQFSSTFDGWVCSEKIKSYAGDFYSLRTWSWHGWIADEEHLENYCTIFYMKNADTYKNALAAINRIKDS